MIIFRNQKIIILINPKYFINICESYLLQITSYVLF